MQVVGTKVGVKADQLRFYLEFLFDAAVAFHILPPFLAIRIWPSYRRNGCRFFDSESDLSLSLEY